MKPILLIIVYTYLYISLKLVSLNCGFLGFPFCTKNLLKSKILMVKGLFSSEQKSLCWNRVGWPYMSRFFFFYSVKIAKEEGGEEFDITPPHPNGTVDLQQIAIALHVPEVDGLKYRVHGTDPWKNVPCIDKLCHPPRPTEPRERRYGERETDCTWGTQTYIMMEKQKKNIEGKWIMFWVLNKPS